jgi:hypothetical protein
MKLKGTPTTEYCDGCSRGSRNKDNQRFVFPKFGNKDLCPACRRSLEVSLAKYLSNDTNHAFNVLKKKHEARVKKVEAATAKAQQSLEAKAKPYVDVGLPEVFALSCARSPEASDSILDLWEATWWNQYEPDDPMITSVLNGQFTEAEAKWMDTFRSDHLDMVWALLNDSVTIEWARALLDSGFKGNIEQVTAALDGGSPKVIARISKLKCNADMIPPYLDSPADCTEPSIPVESAEPEPKPEPEEEIALSAYAYEVEIYIDNLTNKEAKKIIKEMGLMGSSDNPKFYLVEIVRNAAKIESNNLPNKLPKLKSHLKILASELRVMGRSTMTNNQLRAAIRESCRKVKDWSLSIDLP